VEKMGMKFYKIRTNNEIVYFGESRQQQLLSLRERKKFDHREIAGHNAVIKLSAEAKKEKISLHNSEMTYEN
jgi:hypothetical protein